MKKGIRIGIIILMVGVSLLFVTFIRSSSTENLSISFMRIPANSWDITWESYLFPSRDIQLIIDANSTINVYVLNSEGMKLWKDKCELNAVVSFDTIQQDTLNLQISERGEYAILLHNPSNSSASANINITFFGFEKDLLLASSVVTAAGLVTLLAMTLQLRFNRVFNK